MVALHHALEDNDTEGIQRIANLHKISRNSGKNLRFEKGILQQIKGEEFTMFACYLIHLIKRLTLRAHVVSDVCLASFFFENDYFAFFLMSFVQSFPFNSCTFFFLSLQLWVASGAENDLNYFEIPMDIENSLSDMDGRLSADEAVGVILKRFLLKCKNPRGEKKTASLLPHKMKFDFRLENYVYSYSYRTSHRVRK